MATGNTPMPDGWESKFDQRSNRYYYIDHKQQKTQWVDPRLTHPSIWNQARSGTLAKLKRSYPSAPEEKLREQLLAWDFDEAMASMSLQSLGFQPTAAPSPQRQQQQQQQQRPRSARRREGQTNRSSEVGGDAARNVSHNAAQEINDHFALVALKESFPTAPDDVIKEVLATAGSDQAKAVQRLLAMGYVDRAESERKAEAEAAEKRRREHILSRLHREFNAILSLEEVELALSGEEWDEAKTRKSLQAKRIQAEAHKRMAQEFPQISATTRTAVLKAADYKISETRRILQAKIEEAASATSTSSASPSSRARPVEQSNKPKASKISAAPKSRAKSATTKATPTTFPKDHSNYVYETLARGPDPTLRLNAADRVHPCGPQPDNLVYAAFRKYDTPLWTTF